MALGSALLSLFGYKTPEQFRQFFVDETKTAGFEEKTKSSGSCETVTYTTTDPVAMRKTQDNLNRLWLGFMSEWSIADLYNGDVIERPPYAYSFRRFKNELPEGTKEIKVQFENCDCNKYVSMTVQHSDGEGLGDIAWNNYDKK